MSVTAAVVYTYGDNDALRRDTQPAHREYLRGLADSGHLLVAGAWVPGEPAGGLLIFRAADKDAVHGLVADDPYVLAGVVTRSEVREWAPPLGPLAGAFTEQAE